jgi:hypothetical protein
MDPTTKMILVVFCVGIAIGYLIGHQPKKEPDHVMVMGGRIVVVIQEYGKTAYVFTRRSGDYFEFEKSIKPKSEYYPLPEREAAGRTIYSNNPKFKEWVEEWKKFNKVD